MNLVGVLIVLSLGSAEGLTAPTKETVQSTLEGRLLQQVLDQQSDKDPAITKQLQTVEGALAAEKARRLKETQHHEEEVQPRADDLDFKQQQAVMKYLKSKQAQKHEHQNMRAPLKFVEKVSESALDAVDQKQQDKENLEAVRKELADIESEQSKLATDEQAAKEKEKQDERLVGELEKIRKDLATLEKYETDEKETEHMESKQRNKEAIAAEHEALKNAKVDLKQQQAVMNYLNNRKPEDDSAKLLQAKDEEIQELTLANKAKEKENVLMKVALASATAEKAAAEAKAAQELLQANALEQKASEQVELKLAGEEKAMMESQVEKMIEANKKAVAEAEMEAEQIQQEEMKLIKTASKHAVDKAFAQQETQKALVYKNKKEQEQVSEEAKEVEREEEVLKEELKAQLERENAKKTERALAQNMKEKERARLETAALKEEEKRLQEEQKIRDELKAVEKEKEEADTEAAALAHEENLLKEKDAQNKFQEKLLKELEESKERSDLLMQQLEKNTKAMSDMMVGKVDYSLIRKQGEDLQLGPKEADVDTAQLKKLEVEHHKSQLESSTVGQLRKELEANALKEETLALEEKALHDEEERLMSDIVKARMTSANEKVKAREAKAMGELPAQQAEDNEVVPEKRAESKPEGIAEHESKLEDSDSSCHGWALGGECTLNPSFMLEACALSCSRHARFMTKGVKEMKLAAVDRQEEAMQEQSTSSDGTAEIEQELKAAARRLEDLKMRREQATEKKVGMTRKVAFDEWRKSFGKHSAAAPVLSSLVEKKATVNGGELPEKEAGEWIDEESFL